MTRNGPDSCPKRGLFFLSLCTLTREYQASIITMKTVFLLNNV